MLVDVGHAFAVVKPDADEKLKIGSGAVDTDCDAFTVDANCEAKDTVDMANVVGTVVSVVTAVAAAGAKEKPPTDDGPTKLTTFDTDDGKLPPANDEN